MKKVFLFVSFFSITPFVLILAVILFAWHSYSLNPSNKFFALPNNLPPTGIVYAAVPNQQGQIAGGPNIQDARIEKLTAFFNNYGSLLANYAQNFVTAADTYNIDYRLLPSIMMQESIGCKREIPGTHNCAGWGIYHGTTTKFDSYGQAIDTISRLIAKNYVANGMRTPEEIQKLYNPGNNSDWISKVNFFENQINSTF